MTSWSSTTTPPGQTAGRWLWTVDADGLIGRLVTDPRVKVLVTNRPRHAVRRRAALTEVNGR
jgi:hypothetical protein